MSKGLVVKSNAVIEASYRLSVMEQRVILAAISQIRRDQVVSDDVMYELNVNTLRELSGTKSKAIYTDLKEAVNHLYERSIVIEKPPNGREGSTKKLKTRWIQSAIYSDDEGIIKLRFSKDIIPYLNQLNSHFTSYALAEVIQLTSAHAYRLYELLIQYREFGKRNIAIEDLRRWLDLGDKYGALYDLKKRVIDPAVRQINEKTPYQVKYAQTKSGRSITNLVFTFQKKDSAGDSEVKRNRYTQADLNKNPSLARPGETYEMALSRLNRRSVA
ncbi:RepB family plasmid replication initiator protein [Marinobacter sp. ATCH36]|uniref:RepB family plasmid replication initiator protein n=1 Tax=Marinobacter sp. ATCH36 TaxID=2945106 RepID=UPI002020618E|nr:RepB family plasmid replication initiator protein [Marinobacter sp. ATCH36]MCL7946181.1 replication initiation protein [Marinobacter sp. ATCH36]